MGVADGSKKPAAFTCFGACAFLSVAFGVFFVLLGIWATHLKQRFTPVYTDIVCEMQPAKLERFSMDNGLTLDIVSTTTCENPNPYTIQVRSTKAERVFMGEDRTPMAAVTQIPHSTLPANGKGTIEAKVRIKPTGDMIGSLISSFFGKEIPVYIENNMEMVIDVSFLVGRFSVKRPFNKDCGFNFKVAIFGGGAEMGPLVCGNDIDSLQLPPANQPMTGTMRISAVSMAKDEIDKATQAKDVGLGAMMGVGFGLGFLLLICGSWGLWRLFRSHAAAGGREVGDLARNKSPGHDVGVANTTCEMTATQFGAPARRAPEEV